MILSISQPAYLPWLAFFQELKNRCSCIFDDVQIERNTKNSFTTETN